MAVLWPVLKLFWRLSGFILVLATSGCFLFGTYPTTWEARYKKASDELSAAQNDIGRFYALDDAAKAAFEVGETEKALAHAQPLSNWAGDSNLTCPSSTRCTRLCSVGKSRGWRSVS